MSKRYRVTLRETIFGDVTVEADSIDEAKDKALHGSNNPDETVDWWDETSETKVYAVEQVEDD